MSDVTVNIIANFSADIHIGYERTVYTTPESQGLVALCAIIYAPSSGGAPRPFTISYTTANDTAGNILTFVSAYIYM